MERSVWSDERIDDLAARGESQFELLRGELGELRAELLEARSEFRGELGEARSEFRGEMREMRADIQAEFTSVRREMHAEFTSVRRDMFHGAIALFAALVAMWATMLVHAVA